jgi:GT2 family glycosyltransferase
MQMNLGSAGGYHEGIKAAILNSAEFVLLLDDDNCVEPGALSILKQTFESLLTKSSLDRLCVLGFRPDQMPGILQGDLHDAIGESGDTFFGFHVKDLPHKVLSRIRRRYGVGPRATLPPLDRPLRLRTAPFGGMLFHRSLIDRYGYPDSRFILYVDDTEFSYRISSQGGEVWLAPTARIADIDRSWQMSDRDTTSFGVWLGNGSPKHAYYTARNWAYFQSHCREHSWVLGINRGIFITILWVVAMSQRKTGRFHLLTSAIKTGEKGVLGFDPDLPPGA